MNRDPGVKFYKSLLLSHASSEVGEHRVLLLALVKILVIRSEN